MDSLSSGTCTLKLLAPADYTAEELTKGEIMSILFIKLAAQTKNSHISQKGNPMP